MASRGCSKKAALGLLAVLAIARCLAMDVSLGAATIELKRLETYACERMSDACCWRARILLFMLVSLCRYDYCFSGFAKSALAALHTPSRQAKTRVQPHQVVAKRPAS